MKSGKRSSVVMAGLMGCSALAIFSGIAYAATSASAKSSWAVSRVASVSQGSYCTMAQKYDNNAIVSIARNLDGEYSLAVDFQSPVFQSNDPQSITVKAGSGAGKTFDVTPQSQQTIVLPLGRDESLLQSLETSKTLVLSYGGEDMNFKTERFKEGRNELASCLSGIQSKPLVQNIAALDQGHENAPAGIEPAAEKGSLQETGAPISVEGLLEARPTPSMGAEPLSSTRTSVPVGKVEMTSVVENVPAQQMAQDSSDVAVQQLSSEIQALQVENTRLKSALSESRQTIESGQDARSAEVNEIRERLTIAETLNKDLKDQLQQAKKQNDRLIKDTSDSGKKDISKNSTVEIGRLKDQVDALTAENATLRNQVNIATETQNNQPDESALAKQLADLQTANAGLKSEIERLKTASTKDQSQSQVVQNEKDGDLQKKIRELNIRIESLAKEKENLQTSYEKLQKENESSQLKTTGGNWDLEQATRRYQESQREIRRLGALLDGEHVKCEADKKQIEAMLFDPEIAKGSQIAKLNDLEKQVADREATIKSLESRIAALGDQPAKIDTAEADRLRAEIQSREIQIATLSAQMEKMKNSSDFGETQLKDRLSDTEKSLAEKEASLKIANAQLQEKESRISQMQSRLAAADQTYQKLEQAGTESKSTQALVDTLKEDLTSKSTQLGESQAKIAQLEAQLAQVNSISQTQQATATAQMSTVTGLQAQLQAGNLKVAKMEAEIAQLKGQLTAQQQYQKMAQAQAQAQAQVQPQSQQQPVVPTAIQNASYTSAKMVFPTESQYTQFLNGAGVPVAGAIKEVGASSADYKAYSWKTGSLYGSVEMRAVPGVASFDSVEKQYLARAKSRCQGDFAAVPSNVIAANAEKSSAYEIACVGASGSSSASVLFSYGQGIMSTIAHEGRTENMADAIDARDRLAQNIR